MIPSVFARAYFLGMQIAGEKSLTILRPAAALPDEVMDYRGLSAYVKMAHGTLRHKVMKGEIPFFKIGSSVRFSKRDIDVWLEAHRKAAKQNAANVEKTGELPPVDGGEL
jgi:excisionase family DNA binding protein